MLHEKHVLPLEKTERDLQSVHIAVRDLARAFNDGTEDISIRTHATIIMERLCLLRPFSLRQGSGRNVGCYDPKGKPLPTRIFQKKYSFLCFILITFHA